MIRRPFLHTLLLLTLLPVAAFAADAPPAAAPVAGTDYEVIDGGQPFAPVKGKVEVVEVFGYTCPHCAHFQPQLEKWVAQQGKTINFVPVAAPFGGYWMPYARAYYSAQILGVAGKTHDAMFQALHTDGTLPLHDASAEEIAAFYAKYGVDTQRFLATFNGEQTAQRMQQAQAFIRRSGVEGTPTLVINGKYRVIGHSFDDTLRIATQLIAMERNSVARR